MKLIYYGENEHAGYAVLKACQDLSVSYVQLLPDETVSEKEEEIIDARPDYIVFSICDFEGSEDEIVEDIYRIHQGTNAHIIIFAPGYSDESKIIMSLTAMGFTMMITSPVLRHIEETAHDYIERPLPATDTARSEEIITEREISVAQHLGRSLQRMDLYELLGIDDIDDSKPAPDMNAKSQEPEIKLVTESAEPKVDFDLDTRPEAEVKSDVYRNVELKPNKYVPKTVKIAVLGCMPRIGTTTTSLQLVKHLNMEEEHNAAYLEFNKTGFVDSLINYYNTDIVDETMCMATFASVDLYYDPQKLPQILSSGYNYIIYDYGAIDDVVDLVSVMDKDIILLVGGSNASELGYTTSAMKKVFDQRNVFYLFNFAPEEDRQEIKNLMQQLSDKTHMISYTPDPFRLSSKNSKEFDEILRSDYKRIDETGGRHKKMKRLFVKRGD